jgi:enamine deaminase RidA (YjgF/YER057c/UK114 family)
MTIERMHKNARMSQIVVHGDVVYLAGQVALEAPGQSATAQTQDILKRIDTLLAETGTDKSRLLSATVWLTDIRYYAEMNAVWDAWIDPANPPARACVESKLAMPKYDVEIMVTAAR